MKYITTSLAFIFFIFCFPIFGKAQIHPDDSLQLANLYNAICNDGCTLNWNLQEPSTWSGVAFNADGRVTKIVLINKKLSGVLPNFVLPKLEYMDLAINQLTGGVPDLNLPELELFNLWRNQLDGTMSDFSGCPKLVTLGVTNNQLTGPIPDFNLDSLELLALHSNKFSGPIPNFNLPKLKKLELQNNEFTGQVPDFNLTQLTWLEVQNNQLSGQVPSFSGCPSLKRIDLAVNQLTGGVPDLNLPELELFNLWRNQLDGTMSDFSGCPKLVTLGVTNNQLMGPIPDFNLDSLKLLALHDNQFSGSIPSFNLPKLEKLQLQGNNLDGTVPNFSGHPNLKHLDLSRNQFTGNIPILNLPELEWFTLWRNQITGTIPDFSGCPSLLRFTLSENKLTGNIPDFNLSSLEALSLASNQLSGTIPNFNLPNLDVLALQDNNLTGQIPNFNLTSLSWLELDTNQLTGEIPDFNNCPNLKRLDVIGNQLTGNIPNFNLPELDHLYLGDNSLTGTIPNFNQIPKLVHLGLAGNDITAAIPNFTNLPNLKTAYLWDNQLTGNLPDFSNCQNLEELVVYNNTLTGQIPNFNLTSLHRVELQNNQLAGTIPNFNLPNLETLRLYENSLSSPVPEFNNCPNLKRLNMAVNQLTGSVPNYDLPNLEYFSVYDNAFVAPVPDFSNCPKLKVIGLAKNQFSGTVPDYYSDFPDINLVEVHENNFACDDMTTNFASNSLINTFKHSPQNVGSCEFEADSLQLVRFYNETNGPNWSNAWDLNTPVDEWYGVTLNGDGRVTKIIIPDDTLITGNLPDLDFPELTSLNLKGNRLTGTIPGFDGCPELKYLWLYSNQLTGDVPNFNLPNLQEIRLHANMLSGTIPDFELDNLRILHLGFNQLTGTIPNFNLPAAREIIIKNNQFTGTIPNFENCPVLWSLGVEHNRLTGTIPNLALDRLEFFTAYNNQLSGSVPDFNACPKLRYLWLDNNFLTGIIPDFSHSPKLHYARFYRNFFLHEDIATNYNVNQDSINIFYFSPQYYGDEQFRTDTIVGDTVFLSPRPSIPYDNPKVRWRKDGNYVTNSFALHDTTFVIVDMDTTDVGLYEYWFKDETLTPLVEFRSRPINNTIEGLDLNGEPILAGELIIEFGENMSDELIALKRDTLRNKFGGTLVKSCGCHKEIDLWRFGSAAEADKVREIFLNGKVERSSIDSESDGGQNRSNILTPSYENNQKLVVSNPRGGMGTDSEVVIAVIDTGVLPTHVSVQSALKINEDEIPNNNIDDDQNGYVDDIYGMNIIDSLAMSDPNGHGTFVAGIITANIPAGHNIKVMLARAFDETGRGELFDIICSIYYAADNGADIINMSANYKGQMSKALKHAIQYAETQGTMFITSAGNDSLDLYQIQTKYWPATFSIMEGINNVITVTALDNAEQLLDDANYSDKIATIAAIGEGIYAPSNQHDEHYDYISGTSVSTPLVALSLGINKSRNPDRSLSQWREDFLNSDRVETVSELLPYVKEGRKLIIEKSIVNIDSFSVRVLLGGAMLNVNGIGVLPPPMRTDLNMRGLLPGQTLIGLGTPTPAGQPYGDSPFCYLGSEGDNITDYQPDVVDWVMISLREQATASEVYRAAALLREDGEVTLLGPVTAGWANVPDSVYIVVEHRHHIGVMSHQKVPIINTTIAYDFTIQDSYRGNGNTGLGQLQNSDGLWYMASGNGIQENDQPADINTNDKTEWSKNNGFFNIYLNGDYDMNGDVNGSDLNIWQQHNGKSNRVETLDCGEKYNEN